MIDRIAARITITGAIVALLAAALVVQTVRIEGFKFWPFRIAGLKAELSEARAELAGISTAKNEQARTTERTIAKANESQRQAKVITRIIHDAPLPADCGTPALDVARSVL